MTLDRSHVFLSVFAALVAWGIAVRLVPVLWHLANAFLIGALLALLSVLLTTLTTARSLSHPSKRQRPVPLFLRPKYWHAALNEHDAAQEYAPLQLHPSSPVASAAIGGLVDLALRDFISSWYKSISPSPNFVNEVDRNIRSAIIGIRDKLLQEDVTGVLVARIVPIITNHLQEFENAEKVVRSRALNRNLPESEDLDLVIASKYKGGSLHAAASLAYSDTKSLQQGHLRKVLIRILPMVLDDGMMRSRAVSVLVKEIVACAVLFPVLQMLEDPDTWNQIVEAYGKTTLQDRKTVKRMRAALDEHTSAAARRQAHNEIPRLQAHDSERAFERFVRAVRKTKTLADARRFRSQLASQLAREREVEGQDPVFLRRLEMGKRVLDQKIAKMTRSDSGALQEVASEPQSSSAAKTTTWSLAQIMHTASGLSYFMEYMDRQRKIILVQFWVVVDGFRNPLEDDFGDERSTATITWTDNDRLDIAQIAETYIMKSEMNVPQELRNAIQDFLQAGRKASPEQYRAARVAVLSSQSGVQEDLEQNYLPKFRESDLFYNFLTSDDGKVAQRRESMMVNGATTARPAPTKPKVSPLSNSRNNSQAHLSKHRDLRRAALSSSDVKGLGEAKSSGQPIVTRSSLDISKPLFDDDYDTDPLALSIQSLGDESLNGEAQEEPEVLEDMEAALTDIMAQTPNMSVSDTEPDSLSSNLGKEQHATRPALETARTDSGMGDRLKPSLATLGLVNSAGRIGVFQDNDLFGDEERFSEDEYVDREDDKQKDHDEDIHQAAPGDLGLTEAISALSDEIERLISQDAVVDSLTRKAELTNNVAELRILGKSKASLEREIRRKELQRQQYIVQESDNSLYGRASIRIDSVMVGREDDGQEYAMYIIQVQRQAGNQMPAASWAIAHRYSEFHALHQRLRRRYPSTRTLELPRRRMVLKLQKQFLHNRRIALESYLQQLLRMPDVCRSRELRSFLSQQAITQPAKNGSPTNAANTQDIVTRIYNSVTDGMDEFLGNMAVIDQLSAAGQNLMSAATSQMATSTTTSLISSIQANGDVVIEPGSMAEAEAELRAFEDRELTPFVKPICDIFLELFELNRGNNWLRGRAVVVVIHQLLGGTVERKIRDSFTSIFSVEALLRYVETAKNTMWPLATTIDPETGEERTTEERKMRTAGPPRTKAQKEKSRQEAAVVLSTLAPELAGSVVGRANAQTAAKKIAAVMNNKRLNEHLVYTILDEVVAFLFDGAGAKAGSNKTAGITAKEKGKKK